MTKIIATIGPVTESFKMLKTLSRYPVEFARLNFSHNTPQWHIRVGERARQAGLRLILDLAGPKVLLGDLDHQIEVETGTKILIEKQKSGKTYPLWQQIQEDHVLHLPSYFDLSKFLKKGSKILIDDGKLELITLSVESECIMAEVEFGGLIKTHKGINLPGTNLNIDFLVDRDKSMLESCLPILKPEFIAPSFVQSVKDLDELKNFIKGILDSNNIKDYFPKICTKLEMQLAVESELDNIIAKSDMLMIARGDLALETFPLHLRVPEFQTEIAKKCRQVGKPFIIATQMLESMFASPVPTRAEISDIYRAIQLDKADYIMLSGETAAGKYPELAVKFMSEMIYRSNSKTN